MGGDTRRQLMTRRHGYLKTVQSICWLQYNVILLS